MAHHIRRISLSTKAALFLGFALAIVCQPGIAETGTVTVKADMPAPGRDWTAGTIDGILYVGGSAGMCDTSLLGCGLLEAYNPATDTWAYKTPMRYPRYFAGSGVVNGILYIVGGQFWTAYVPQTLESYDPKSDRWTTKAAMTTARSALGAVGFDGKLYAIGGTTGRNGPNPILGTVEAYDPVTDAWSTKAPMPTPRAYFAVAAVDGIIYAIGGATNTGVTYPNSTRAIRTVDAYDTATNTWSPRAPLPYLTGGEQVACVIDGIIYVFIPSGGANPIVAYDPKTDRWTIVGPFLISRAAFSAGASGDVAYVVGGYTADPNYKVLATNEAFTPFLSVTIRVNPATINLRSNAKIKVAILSTSTFDATAVIPDSLKLSGALADTEANGTPLFSFDDVNGDGILDLVLTFRARDLQLTRADKQVVLKGQTFAGQLIKGVASVRIVP
ncbi:MAG TPA: kelch repeat-containing protein [Terriglobia bacterium]|nr:kelch repeat-containing protein [Terriglobia bacterium]